MKVNPIPKPLAMVLSTLFERVASAREAVEHRLESLAKQEKLVECWTNDSENMAAREYPGHALSSYPVQTRMARELDKLHRYRSELPERMFEYAYALNKINSMEANVDKLARGVFKGVLTPRPAPPSFLNKNPWPSSWPMRKFEAEAVKVKKHIPPQINRTTVLTDREPEYVEFILNVSEHEVMLTARYGDGIQYFTSEFEDFVENTSSSRWRAITEAIRCDIRWPQLEQYLSNSPAPWLPRLYVDEEFGLRGSMAKREALSDLMAKLSPNAARWYLSQQPGRVAAEGIDLLPNELSQLFAAGLVRVGSDMSVENLLESVPFTEVKCLFILAGLAAPSSYKLAVTRFPEVRAVRTEWDLRSWLEEFVDSAGLLEVMEVPSLTREERLGPRARANVLVSSLVLLADGDSGAHEILKCLGE